MNQMNTKIINALMLLLIVIETVDSYEIWKSLTVDHNDGGWIIVYPYHKRACGYLSDTYVSGFVIEDLWGNDLLRVERAWESIVSSHVSGLECGGTLHTKMMCSKDKCGPSKDDKTFIPLIKNLPWRVEVDKIRFKINDASVSADLILHSCSTCYSTSSYESSYTPTLHLSCDKTPTMAVEYPEPLLKSIGGKKILASEETETIRHSIINEKMTSFDWLLKAGMNGGSNIKFGIEEGPLKAEGGNTLNWMIETQAHGKVDHKTTETFEKTISKKRSESIECTDNLYIVYKKACASVDLSKCKFEDVEEAYKDRKPTGGTFKTCMQQEIMTCSKAKTKQEMLEEAKKLALNSPSKHPLFGSDDTAKIA